MAGRRVYIMSSVVVAIVVLMVGMMGGAVEAEGYKLFHLRPDIPSSASVELDGIECIFTFKTNGGTGEEWFIELTRTVNGKYSCSIGRPTPPSYLFFNSFDVAIKNAEIEEVEVLDNGGAEVEVYSIAKRNTLVRSKKDWSGSIAFIQVVVS